MPQAAPTPPANWADRTPTPGHWAYFAPQSGYTRAVFGASLNSAVFDIECNSSQRVVNLSAQAAPGPTGMTVRTTTLTRTMGATAGTRADGWPPIVARAVIDANDPLLDAIAFTRGRFLVSVPGQTDLVLPIWPEFARVVEDCRG